MPCDVSCLFLQLSHCRGVWFNLNGKSRFEYLCPSVDYGGAFQFAFVRFGMDFIPIADQMYYAVHESGSLYFLFHVNPPAVLSLPVMQLEMLHSLTPVPSLAFFTDSHSPNSTPSFEYWMTGPRGLLANAIGLFIRPSFSPNHARHSASMSKS